MSEQGTGNIEYSFNKNRYYEIIDNNKSTFIVYYIFTTFICFFFITGSFILNGTSISKYITKKTDENGTPQTMIDRKIYDFFSQYCLGSPMNIIDMHKHGIEEKLTPKEIEDGEEPITYIGLRQNSYIFLIIVNLIGILIINEALLKNFMSSIIVNFIQENKNNNPYNNPNNITKVSDSPAIYINKNYSKLLSLSFVFIIPFTITFILKYILAIDRYDIKKTGWIKNLVFISLVLPTVIVIIYRLTGHSSITLFSTIDRFIHKKDKPYINFMKMLFSLKYFIIYTFMFVLLLFLSLHWIFGPINKYITGYWKYIHYFFIIVVIYMVLPLILSSNAISTCFNVYKKNNIEKSENEIIDNIQKYGAQSLYDLIVKYNYPCFKK